MRNHVTDKWDWIPEILDRLKYEITNDVDFHKL